jgi:hypothetical protein
MTTSCSAVNPEIIPIKRINPTIVNTTKAKKAAKNVLKKFIVNN